MSEKGSKGNTLLGICCSRSIIASHDLSSIAYSVQIEIAVHSFEFLSFYYFPTRLRTHQNKQWHVHLQLFWFIQIVVLWMASQKCHRHPQNTYILLYSMPFFHNKHTMAALLWRRDHRCCCWWRRKKSREMATHLWLDSQDKVAIKSLAQHFQLRKYVSSRVLVQSLYLCEYTSIRFHAHE